MHVGVVDGLLFIAGMLLRLFMAFYDLEIIEEDAFLRWREDINDEYPGKGKALFQVSFQVFFPEYLTLLLSKNTSSRDLGSIFHTILFF